VAVGVGVGRAVGGGVGRGVGVATGPVGICLIGPVGPCRVVLEGLLAGVGVGFAPAGAAPAADGQGLTICKLATSGMPGFRNRSVMSTRTARTPNHLNIDITLRAVQLADEPKYEPQGAT